MKVLKSLSPLKTRTTLAGILMAAAFLSPAAAASTGGSPEAVVNTAVERTLAALEDAKISNQEADSILELIDVDQVAPFTMGRHWRTMDEATKREFLDAFRKFARGQLRDHLSGFSQADVEILRTLERRPGDTIVTTKVSNGDGDEHLVSWRVTDNDGWKVTDIETMGLWFAIEQRAQFQAMLDKNGGNIRELISEIGAAR